MVVATLAWFAKPPDFAFFQNLEFLTILIVIVLGSAAVASSLQLIVLPSLLRRLNSNSRTPKKQSLPRGCHRRCGPCSHKCMKTVFWYMARLLCVYTFPALFKMHKTRSRDGRQTRQFIVFLDRKVENNLSLVAAFCSIVISIFYVSAMVFVQYFPVEESEECLEKDSHGQPLFCYINSSIPRYPNLPVDCANYNAAELRELKFVCYALTFPGGLGIAVAAALGFAKVVIVSIIIFIRVSEGILTWAKGKHCANRCYQSFSILLLVIATSALIISLSILAGNSKTLKKAHQLATYVMLPALLFVPLFFVILKLKDHCDRGEYISFAADQRPIDQSDWDEEPESSMTEREQDEASRQRESGCSINDKAPDDDEETSLIEARGSTNTNYGVI